MAALLCWIGIEVPRAIVCRSGLASLGLPGLSGEEAWVAWTLWIFAAAVVAADSVLLVAWLRFRSGVFLGAVVVLGGLTLGLETMNVEVAMARSRGVAAAAEEVRALLEAKVEEAEEEVVGARREVARWIETRHVWERDGRADNDGGLEAAERLLRAAESDLEAVGAEYRAAAGTAVHSSHLVHPLAGEDRPGWIVASGLLALKLVALALAAGMHGFFPVEVLPLSGRKTGAVPLVRRAGGRVAQLAEIFRS